MKKPLEFKSGEVEPACLNMIETKYVDDLMASGWGTTSISVKDTRTGELTTGELSTVLKKAYFFEDPNACEDYLICIDSKNGASVCQGDSGGPLHYTTGGRVAVEGRFLYLKFNWFNCYKGLINA